MSFHCPHCPLPAFQVLSYKIEARLFHMTDVESLLLKNHVKVESRDDEMRGAEAVPRASPPACRFHCRGGLPSCHPNPVLLILLLLL